MKKNHAFSVNELEAGFVKKVKSGKITVKEVIEAAAASGIPQHQFNSKVVAIYERHCRQRKLKSNK